MKIFQVRKFAADDAVQHVLHRDYETRGVLQLQKVGVWKYAADDHTEMLCCAFCVDSEPVKLWLPGDPVPAEFLEAANNPAWLACAHNAQFELAIEHLIMRRRHGWPKIPLRQQRCTMAAALALALPPKLELIAEVLELLHQKDQSGQRLMLMMSKPRRARKNEDPEGRYWFDEEDRRQRLYGYCRKDVEVERELYQQLRPLPPEEQKLWLLDLLINVRGFRIDRDLAAAARAVASYSET
jgi:DNA polymerase bacteriophage-type